VEFDTDVDEGLDQDTAAEAEAEETQGASTTERSPEFWQQEISDLVPEELPYAQWDSYAEKLAALARTTGPATEEPAEAIEEPVQTEPTPQEQRLAAAGMGPLKSLGVRGGSDLSAKDILELGKSHPARAFKGIRAKYRQ
jgi:hypothetical protein